MSTFLYPGSDYDRADVLLGLLGGFWANTYDGQDFVRQLLYAKAQGMAQAHLDLLDLVAATSRFNVPVFHRENWHFCTFRQSQLNNFDALLPEYRNQSLYLYDNQLHYGVVPPQAGNVYCFPAPADLRDVKVIMNRITSPSLTWTKDIDFWLPEEGVLAFRQNPFENPYVPVQEILADDEVADRIGGLWLYRGAYDWDTVYEQFGYALRMRLKSSQGYKDLMNAVLGSMITGPDATKLNQAWSAITDVPLVIEPSEIVEEVTGDLRSTVVITDKHAYKFALGSMSLVEVGDVVHLGQPLTDTLEFFEFNRGQVPDELVSLAVGPGFLANGYWGDLAFDNKDVPLVVEENVEGYTKVSFQIEGNPLDVEAFWDEVHRRGITQGKTLAQCLDVRTAPDTEPTAASLPATVNPLKFLCSNLFRFHVFVVRIRARLMGGNRLGLAHADHLRKALPPEKAMIVLVELEYADEPITLEGPGTEEAPGYEEGLSGFPCMTVSEVLDGPTMIRERVRLYQIQGKCE